MKCDLKTMLKVGLILGGIIVIGAIAFPQFRPVIIGFAPFALFALCPISMFFAMRVMNPVRNKVSNGVNKGQHKHTGCASCAEKDHKKHAQIS